MGVLMIQPQLATIEKSVRFFTYLVELFALILEIKCSL